MSKFEKFSTAQSGTVLISNEPLYSGSPNNGFSVNTIAITNSTTDAAIPNCDVEVFIELTSGGDYSVMKVNIPQKATAIYDKPFSFMDKGSLKITTSNNSAITVIIS